MVFLPNYSVSLAETIIPAADLSEQISTAGMEASGTGNMKFALNGALTVGTLDGANIEIRDHVGADNIFIFGLEADGVRARQAEPDYAARAIQASPRLAAALDMIASGRFSPEEPGRFRPLTDDLRRRDQYLLTADFDDYWRVQRVHRRRMARPARLVGEGDPQHRPDGVVLLRPGDARIRRRDLAGPAGLSRRPGLTGGAADRTARRPPPVGGG